MKLNPDFEEWLRDRPPIVQELGRKFPPGSFIIDHNGVKLWVVSFGEDGSLGVSETNPAEDYKKAVATRKPVCACCIESYETRPPNRNH